MRLAFLVVNGIALLFLVLHPSAITICAAFAQGFAVAVIAEAITESRRVG